MRLGWLTLGGAVGVVLALQLAGFAFMWPQIDDWLRLRLGWELGPWGAMLEEYQRWSGRWAGLLVVTATGWLFGRGAPVGAVSLLAWLVFAGAVIANIVRYLVWVPLAARLGVGFLLTLWVWTRMPAVGDGVYWLTGIMDNLLGWGLIGWATALMPWRGRGWGSWLGVLGASVLTALACGTHELLALGAIAAWLGVLILGWRWGWPGWVRAFGPMVGGALSLGVVALAPGNAKRTSELGGLSEPGIATAGMLTELLLNYPRWLLDAGLWLIAGLLLTLARREEGLGRMPQAVASERMRHGPAWMAGWLLVVSVLMLWGACWAISARPPGRTINLVFVTVLAALGVLLCCYGPRWAAWLDGRCAGWRGVRPLMAGLLGVALLAGHNVGFGGVDVVRRYWDYRAVMRERERLVAAYHAGGARGVLTVPHVAYYPISYHMGDVGLDADSLLNRQWAAYYGVEAVVASGVPRQALR